jgi:hypothetical protein
MPRIRRVPDVSGETQPIIRIVLLLPAPFGPRNPNASPRRTATSIPATADELAEALRELPADDQGVVKWLTHDELRLWHRLKLPVRGGQAR